MSKEEGSKILNTPEARPLRLLPQIIPYSVSTRWLMEPLQATSSSDPGVQHYLKQCCIKVNVQDIFFKWFILTTRPW